MESKSRQIFSLQNREPEKTQEGKSRIKNLNHTNNLHTKTIKKNIYLSKKSKLNTLKRESITRNTPYTSKIYKIQKNINKTLDTFYKDIYNNYLLILFFNSKNKNEYISNVKKLSLKLDNYKLSHSDIEKYKVLYYDLKKRIKKKIKTRKIYKSHLYNKHKFKNINSLLKGGNTESYGGPYLQRLTNKGSEPITGDDMAKTMEEILTILSDLRYLDDAKEAYGPTVLLNYFMGNEDDLKSFLRYRFLPQFVKVNQFPPKIEFGELYDRWDNIVDLLNVYKNDRRIKNEWAVSKGLKAEDVLKPSFIDKLAEKIDAADQKFQKIKMLRKGDLLRIAV